jgi:hypothetical protein
MDERNWEGGGLMSWRRRRSEESKKEVRDAKELRPKSYWRRTNESEKDLRVEEPGPTS